MPVKIHHGPPGSYKTAGAVADDFMPQARAGRVIVTNVRGLTRDSVLAEFPDLPETFDVINIDTSVSDGQEKIAKWFHWVPRGAFLFMDEAQMIWPKAWRQSDIEALDYPGGVDQAKLDGRPHNWTTAWEMHRHYNWDFVLTTPAIKKIRDDIRHCCESAFKHKNLATLGIKGRYQESFHLADDDGGSVSQMLSQNFKKVPSYVFRIYESTATGNFSDSKTGLSILKNPKVAFLLFLLFLFSSYLIYFFFIRSPPQNTKNSVFVSSKDNKKDSSNSAVRPDKNFNLGSVHVPGVILNQNDADIKHGPLSGSMAHIQAGLKRGDGSYRYLVNVSGKIFSNDDLREAGYLILPMGFCLLELNYRGERSYIKCSDNNSVQSGFSIAKAGGV